MADKILIDSMLKRLLAAFPSFKPRPETLAVYIEHMEKMDATALRKAVDLSEAAGTRFPTIADLRKRAGRGENLPPFEPPPEPVDDRSGRSWITDALPRDRSEIFRTHFALGADRAEQHMEEQLAAGEAFRAAHPEQAKW